MDPMGHVDDKYWLGDGEKISPKKDYRHSDPGNGGYANNIVSGVPNPMMLPTAADAVFMGALDMSKSEIYTKAGSGRLPEGFAVPGIDLPRTPTPRRGNHIAAQANGLGWGAHSN